MGQLAINCTDDVKLKQFVKITPPDISLSFSTLQKKKILENRASVTQKKVRKWDWQATSTLDWQPSLKVKDVKSLTANNPDHHKI